MKTEGRYQPVSNKPDFPAMEKGILDFWRQGDVFGQSLRGTRASPEFVFYDGPPFATGLPHYGHLLAGTIKDIVPRYQTMRGRFVDRRFGWDCHGLPVEYEVEQDLKISGKQDIEKLGVDVFNERCRGIVLRYTREWRDVVTRMGRWVDFDRGYKTMDPSYMESIWWVFKSLWEKELIYQGQKILPCCPRCATPLSNFEANQGYAEVTDPAITVRFAATDEPRAYFLAWTTTPWTLPSNLALAVGPEIEYARVEDRGEVYYLARSRVETYYPKGGYERLTVVSGRDLVGRTYEPLFPYFSHLASQRAFRVVPAGFVSTEEGTGIVHIAPGFGEDDYEVGKAEGLPVVCPVDNEGRFTAEVPDYAGQRVKDADDAILQRLKKERKLVHRATLLHSYPHCWRCDTALIYRGVSTWFVRVTELRERLLAANRQVRWVPEHLRDGRFGKWLEGAKDWAISRNRYWGTPLPVWTGEDGREVVCVGSIAELERLSGLRVGDLHKHHVDGILIPSGRPGGAPLRRVPEVLDCWFESGAMPYAQAHYPFENREHFEGHFPADFIAEGLDQTRGWFYTLMVLSVALFDKPAFRNVIVNGLVLAEDGRKMSKRLKNYPDPSYILETYGADALRLYLVHSPVVRAEDLRFSEEGVTHVLRHLLLPLWNAYSFFVTYANIDGWSADAEGADAGSVNPLDRWIVGSLDQLVAGVTAAMDAYDLQRAVWPFVEFIEKLTNWYIRRSRRRFWKSQDDDDKAAAYRTLHHVLLQFSMVAAPFIPFTAESMYRNLRRAGMPESVHLCRFPAGDGRPRDARLIEQMDAVIAVVGLARQLRAERDLKVRQPLSAMHVVCRDAGRLAGLRAFEDIILDELNVKTVIYGSDETGLATFRMKADFKRLGPRLGPRVKTVARLIASLDGERAAALVAGRPVTLADEGGEVTVGPEDVVVERLPKPGLVVASAGDVVVALETQLTPELVTEGLAREFVNKVQNMRKTADLDVTQRIHVVFNADEDVKRAVETHGRYIATETLALNCCSSGERPAGATDWDLNGHAAAIAIAPSDAAAP